MKFDKTQSNDDNGFKCLKIIVDWEAGSQKKFLLMPI